MTVQWVMPSVDPEYRLGCLLSMTPDICARTLVVDNTETNLGVAASWNLGIDEAVTNGADWLVIVSESMRFGETGGADFEGQLTGSWATATCDRTCFWTLNTGAGFCRNGYGFHLFGLAMSTVEQVGRFDEIFYPAWWEDADYYRRMALAGMTGDTWTHLDHIDAHLAACEHSTATGLVEGSWSDTRPAYIRKWGGEQGSERYLRPYGNPDLTWRDITRR